MEKVIFRQKVLRDHLHPTAARTSQQESSSISPAPCLAGDSAAYQRTAGFGDDVVIVAAYRTALCKAKRGGFKDTHPDDLLAPVLKAVIEKTKINPAEVGDIVVGTVLAPGSTRATECRIAAFYAAPMAPSYTSSLAVLLLLSVCIPLQNAVVFGDTDLIEKTCKASKYYDLCISSLSSNKTSQNADPKGLAIIMVQIGAANASSTNAYLSSLVQSISNAANTVTMKKLIADCAKRYSYAVDAMQASVQDLEDDGYDYAYMHVMAAADYPNVCRNNFRRAKAAAYPAELAVREEALKRICQVVLGIIDSLGGGLM